MEQLSKEIKEKVRKLFEEEKVDLVIGYEKGTLPFRSTPCFVKNAEDAEKLVWNSCCENNLAAYIPGMKGKIGIIAKGCDSRSLVGHIKEKQIERENLIIIGVPCHGMLDRKSVDKIIAGREITDIEEKPDGIVFKGENFEETVTKNELLPDNCISCSHRNPVLYDILIGENVEENKDTDEFGKIKEYEAKTSDERWDYFSQQIGKCIRCYACRNACPLCYCKECCVDSSQPQWFGKSIALSDAQVFHIMRAFHVAGRCVDCGACVRACPMEIDLRFLNKKVEKDVRELFNFEAGINLDEPPPLSVFRPDDPDGFIKG
ncbi:MAG: 4Fe-4S dicluster domain-containing protein [Proteobacteria bacterium]|nr:4Fe-4S dicluster domain-containing protein [Pseudomonadota bacterium]